MDSRREGMQHCHSRREGMQSLLECLRWGLPGNCISLCSASLPCHSEVPAGPDAPSSTFRHFGISPRALQALP